MKNFEEVLNTTKNVLNLLESIYYNEPNDLTKEFENHRIENDLKAFKGLDDTVKKFMNPSTTTVDRDNLINIVGGKVASAATFDFLLRVKSEGTKQKHAFIEECAVDEARFKKCIKKQVFKLWKWTIDKKTKKGDNGQRTSVRIGRDIFGPLLATSLNKKIHMATCL